MQMWCFSINLPGGGEGGRGTDFHTAGLGVLSERTPKGRFTRYDIATSFGQAYDLPWNLSNEMFFALICAVLFEKQLHVNQ